MTLIKGTISQRTIKKSIKLTKKEYQQLFALESNEEQNIDFYKLNNINRELKAIKLVENPRLLSFDKIEDLEAIILKRFFNRIFGMEFETDNMNTLKCWDSPICVLQAFILYCLEYKESLKKLSLSIKHIFTLFLINSSEHIGCGRIKKMSLIEEKIQEYSTERVGLWKKQQVLLAISDAMIVRSRSIMVINNTHRPDSIDSNRLVSIQNRLEQNFELCYKKLEWRLFT